MFMMAMGVVKRRRRKLSGTTIRVTQIKMEKHPASPFKGKINKRETG
jgi:hypothetical protein